MDKKFLEEYIDACMLLKETEKEIQKLEQKKMPAILGKVKGSNQDFPYQECSFTISGTEFDYEDDKQLRVKKEILEERKKKAEEVKLKVEKWMNTIPMRMQRIVKYKFFEGLSWEETAAKINRKTTGDSVRKEFEKFMKLDK